MFDAVGPSSPTRVENRAGAVSFPVPWHWLAFVFLPADYLLRRDRWRGFSILWRKHLPGSGWLSRSPFAVVRARSLIPTVSPSYLALSDLFGLSPPSVLAKRFANPKWSA